MVGQIEERIQIYTEGAKQVEIFTRQRYVSQREAAALLKQAGFSDIRVTEGYAESGFHPLREEEVTDLSVRLHSVKMRVNDLSLYQSACANGGQINSPPIW